MTLQTMNKSNRMYKFFAVAMLIAFCLCTAVLPCFAAGTGGIQPAQMNTQGLNTAMGYVLTVLTSAAKWVGAVISAWGIFQIIMAMRREDSEAISKQIMTVVVGAVLIAFGLAAPQLISTLVA